jgi:hypothetical protein
MSEPLPLLHKTSRRSACIVPSSTWWRNGSKGGADVGDLAMLVAESLVNLILLVPESEQAKLLAHTVSALGDLFLQKSGVDGGGSGSTH